MDNMQKGFLIAGGLLILGFLGYTLFGKKEEEIEEAEYYIVVDTNTGETKRQEEKKQESDSLASEEPVQPEISIIKRERIAFEQVENVSNAKDKTKPTSFLKMVEQQPTPQTTHIKTEETSKETGSQQKNNVNNLEVIAPQEVVVEANDEFPLKLGSKGQRVWDLKVYLMKNHGGAGIITDKFDKQTAERVLRFLKVEQVTEQHYKKLRIGQPRKKKRNATKT